MRNLFRPPVLFAALVISGAAQVWAQTPATNTWNTSVTTTAWVRNSNWGTTNFIPGRGPNNLVLIWGSITDVAQVGSTAGSGTLGINLGSNTANGITGNGATGSPYELGAIVALNALNKNLIVNNSSSTGGLINFNGGVGLNGVIIDNQNSSFSLTITNGASTGTLGIVANNSSNNIIKSAGGAINIGSIISGANPVEFQGSGIIALYATNTYSGNTTISSGTLTLSGTASMSNSPNITIASGANFNVSVRSSRLSLANTQVLRSSATGTGTSAFVTVSSATGVTLGSSGGLAFTAYGGGATAPLAINGSSAGDLALNGAPVRVTTTTALSSGTYKLVAKSGSAAGVTGTPGSLTVNGSGLAAGMAGTLSVSNGELFMTVALQPTITGGATAAAFTTTYGTASAEQTFSISGSNLTANLVATAPSGFEVSADGTSYSSTATFTQSSGSASGTLRVRLSASAPVSDSYNSQNIVLSTTGATSVNVTTASSGNAVAKATPLLSLTSTKPCRPFLLLVSGFGLGGALHWSRDLQLLGFQCGFHNRKQRHRCECWIRHPYRYPVLGLKL
jgi:autotransporter-associated beta strand protein